MSATTLSIKFFLLVLLFQIFKAQTCTEGSYFDTGANGCQPCDQGCKACSGNATYCTDCYFGINFEGQCYPECDTSMYFNTDSKSCDICHPSCSECTGGTAQDCTNCYPPNTLDNGKCKCQEGQYLDDFGICQTCNTFCRECEGDLANQCSACYNNMVVTNGQIGECGCPAGSALDINGKKCVACSDSCAQCSAVIPATCQACKNNLALQNGECVCTGSTYLDTTTYTCKPCAAGTYFSNGQCEPCHGSCQACTGPLDTDCSTCKTGLQKGTNNKCGCTGNTFLDTTTFTCKTCDATCATCSAASATSCLTCPGGMTLSASKTCVCDQGTYWDSASSSCKTCHGSCQACTGPLDTDCSTCKTGLQKGTNNKCGCTGANFLDTTTYTCRACDPTCATCSAASATSCLACSSGMTLSASKTCECDQGTYWDASSSSCKACYGGCRSCTGALETDCLTCKSGLQMGTDGKCGCTGKTYLNTATFTCDACNSVCNQCSGPSASQCLSCPADMTLSASKTCECDQGTYWDASSSSCKTCYGGCRSCTGALETDCSTCKSGLQKGPDGKCGCTGNTYLNTDTFTCSSCASTCDGCSGPLASECNSCKPGLIRIGNKCECPDKMYLNEEEGQCYACDRSCNHCSGPNPSDCIACPENQVLIGGICSECPSGTYLDSGASQCKPCHKNCEKCTGPEKNQCSACKNNLMLGSGPVGECICSSSQFLNVDEPRCETCASTCSECSGSSYEQCTICKPNWTYSNGKCIEPCAQGQYNAQDGSCSVCDSSCLECNGSGSNSCISCPPGQNLIEGKCTAPIVSSLCPEGLIFVEDQDTCLSQCPPSYYVGSRGSDPVCRSKTVIENRVTSTRKIDEYRITFNAQIAQLYPELASLTAVSIEFRSPQQQPIQYNSTLSLNDDLQSILIKLGITGHLLPYNLMVIKFNLTDDDNQTSYTLLNKELSVTLYEYYSYSSSTEDAVKTTSKMNEVGQKTNEVITWGTSFILQSIHSIRSELMESMIAYFLYMNITFPPNFISYALGNLEASDMFLPNAWSPVLDSLEKSNNVENIDSSRRLQEDDTGVQGQGLGIKDSDLRFLSDVGTSVTFLLVILILIGAFDLLFYVLQRKKMHGKPIYKATEYLNYHLKWSYFINEFISEYQGITFASIVALIYTSRFTPDAIFDYVFSVIFFIITVLSIFLVIYLIRYIHRNNRRNNPAAIAAAVVTAPERAVTDGILVTAGAPVDTPNPEDPTHQPNDSVKPILIRLNVLHIEFNNKSIGQLLYPLFLMLRCFGFTLVLALCQASPVFQCVYLMLVTLAIMIYILKIKPFRKRAQMILSLTYEGIFFSVATIALSLHIYNTSHLADIETRSMLGFGIVAGALLMMILNFVALFFEILELRKYIKYLKVLMFWKKSMAVGPMQQLTRADTKQPLEETQHSHLNTQLTSSNSNLLKMGIRKSISIDEKTYAKAIGSSKEISFTDEVNRTDEGTLTLNNLPTEPQVKANNNDSSASIFKFYKYSMKEVDDEIKEDPEEIVNESFNPEKTDNKSPISSLNKLAGAEDYDAFNCSSIDKLDSILKKERESESSLKGRDLESKISLPGSGNDTLKEGLQQEDLQTEQQGGKSKSKSKRSRTKSKDKSKGHKRSLNSIAAIFGFTYTDVSGKTVISKVTPNKSKKIAPAPVPKRMDWSVDMGSQGDRTRQIEERNFSRPDEDKENEYTRTVVSARDEKSNPWNNTLDMKIMLNSAKTNELQFLNNQTSSEKDEENPLAKFVRVRPFESLESLPLDKDEPSVEYQSSKEDIQETPSKERPRNKAFDIHTKRLRSMKSIKSMKSIDENDEEPRGDTEQSEIRIQDDEGNRSRQKLARPLGKKRGDISVERNEQRKEGKAQRVFSLNPKKD